MRVDICANLWNCYSCVRTMPISADEFCELLTSYGVEYAESK